MPTITFERVALLEFSLLLDTFSHFLKLVIHDLIYPVIAIPYFIDIVYFLGFIF